MSGLLKKGAIALGALVGSLAAAEAVYRVVEPAPYRPGEIRRSDGSVVPLSEIIAATRAPLEYKPGATPRAAAPANLRWRVSYDRPAPGYFDADGSYDVTTNRLGFRDREFDVEKKPGEIRILCVGDSFTYGQGVRNDDAWPQVLERRIRDRIGDPVEVINGGFAAASHWPAGYVEWIDHDG
ncbi:MAG TPA: hypothetical protein VKE69_12250, partial [Planctomycetota bacterium]|nr:hypothetical protein [Planctomycetota bacterium]